MRVIERQYIPQVLTMSSEIIEVRDALVRIANALKFRHRAVYRKCTREWFGRVERLCKERLHRELRCILSYCGYRTIADFYRRYFRHSRAVIKIVGQYLIGRGAREVVCLAPLIEEYGE